ncbi:DUF4332 domain-containing protein [Botrimarina sp.]|uniref:DUF4332 domain-containing protein n=1 Tax=Botrimarina sp. TaxID=2795802 RepID=UPI0032EDF905
MRIIEASVSRPTPGRDAVERLSLGAVGDGLACYRVRDRDDSAAFAGLLAELLLGASDPRWPDLGEGVARIATRHGDLKLRRSGGAGGPRLSMALAGPRPADAPPPGPSDWQSIVPPPVIAAVFFASADEPAALDRLLGDDVAQAYTRLAERRPRRASAAGRTTSSAAKSLLNERDELVARIEATLADRRRESAQLDEQIEEWERQRAALAQEVDELRRRVDGLTQRLTTEGARRRYEEASRLAAEASGRHAQDQWAPRVEELDEEVARWRATLAELERRESCVRSELSRLHPDDTAPQLLLADQRASVAVATRLVADLEAEVARFARAGGSPECLCSDAHARLNPLVETLGRHVAELGRLVAQQDDAQRIQDLLGEAHQLERSQTELRRQLDHLLQRRQTLWRSTRARMSRDDGAPPEEADSGDDRRQLRRWSDELAEAEAALDSTQRSHDDALERRRRLLDDSLLEAWRRELDRVQARIDGAAAGGWAEGESLRASEVLARLSDGEWTELRLAPGGRRVELRDRSGRVHAQRDVSAPARRLVVWALRLALADAAHAAGAPLPLVLDQPFASLDERAAANLATCLDDYARRGRQVLLFTTDGPGLQRLVSLGVSVRRITEGEALAEPRGEAPPRVVEQEESFTRPCLLDPEDPIERFPVPLPDRAVAFGRARVRTVGDLLGADPSAVAEEMAVDGVTAELVALWQAHAALVAFTPRLELSEAKLLVECGVLSVEELASADADRVADALRRRGVDNGEAAAVALAWIDSARGAVGRWRDSRWADSWRRNRDERRERIRDNARRKVAADGAPAPARAEQRPPRREQPRPADTAKRRMRFYLEQESDIEAAPSIGPKRADQLRAIGVRTVAQLLEGDPEEIAERLDHPRVDTARVVAWQHQAGLMCRVPGLRGHDAQILVGCGFTAPEEIAGMKPAELLEFVDPFCDSREGQRVLRGAERPDLAEVTEWVRGARQRRAVGAA